jgi:hypothetical protein
VIPVPRRRRIVRGRKGEEGRGRRDESEGKGLSQQVDREPIVPDISSLIFASVSLEKQSRMIATSFSKLSCGKSETNRLFSLLPADCT